MRRAWRWFRRGVLALLALVVVALGAALIVVHTDWGRELIRGQVEAVLQEKFPGATIGKLEGSVFTTLVLSDIVVPARGGGAPLARIGAVRVELALGPLLRRTARIDRLIVEDVAVDLRPEALPVFPPPEPQAWNLELTSIVLRRATIRVATPQGPATLDGVELAASVTMPIVGALTALAHVRGTWRERRAPWAGTVAFVGGEAISVPFASLDVGGAWVVASATSIEPIAGQVVGQVVVGGSAGAIERLVPGVELPAAALVSVTARPVGAALHVTVRGRLGAGQLDAAVLVDVGARAARGVVAVTGVELGPVTRGLVHGRSTVIAALTTDGVGVHGTVIANTAVVGAPRAHAIIGIDARADHVDALVVGTGAGGLVVGGIAAARRDGERVEVEHARLAVSTRDLAASSAGRLPLAGTVSVSVSARGPIDALEVSGRVDGRRLRRDDLVFSRLEATFAGRLGETITGGVHANVRGVRRAGVPLGSARLDVSSLPGGKFAVHVNGGAALAPFAIDARAVVTLGDVLDVALGRHRIRVRGMSWAGRGGSIRIDDRKIVVRGLRTASGASQVAIDASVGRLDGALSGTVEARGLDASLIDPSYRGTVAASLSLGRRGLRWNGGGTVTAVGLALTAEAVPLDASLTVNVDGRRVRMAGRASNPQLGAAEVAIEVDGPRDLTDPLAWRRVARGDLHVVTIGVTRFDLGALTDAAATGIVDGKLEIREGVPTGALTITGATTPVGDAAAQVTLSLTEVGFVDVHAQATVGPIRDAVVDVRLQIPDRPFDPGTWQRLGPAVIASASARVHDVVFDPRTFAMLGIDAPYRGVGDVTATVGAGARSLELAVDLRDVRGGQVMVPLSLHAGVRADASGTRGQLQVRSGAVVLLDLPDATIPVSIDRWLTAPASARTAPIAGTLTIPRLEARDALALVGRTDVRGGTIAGEITVGGTVQVPTGRAEIELRDIEVSPRLARRPPPRLNALRLVATWGGASGRVEITGEASNRGTLAITASGRPDQLASVLATIKISRFELAPVVVFLPGPLAGASGVLDADVVIRGLEPATGSVRGELSISSARLPIAPMIGTLRRADAKVRIDDRGMTATLAGRLGAGSIAIDAKTGRGAQDAEFKIVLTKVSPIGALEPVIDATMRGKFRRAGLTWRGTIAIDDAAVLIPERASVALLDPDAPEDLIFLDQPEPPQIALVATAPERPWLVADIELGSTQLSAPEFAAKAIASGKLRLAVGNTVGLDGEINVERGNLDWAGHRYRVERGQVAFDGTPDALIDVKLAHEFPEVTTYVRFAGRLSEVEQIEPEFTSDPATYSEGQLVGFFLGGAPGGDPSRQAREAVTGLGASLLSSRLGRRFLRYSPIKLDVLRCVPGTGSSGATCTFGRWVTERVFLSYRQPLDDRLDEDNGAKLEFHWRPNWVFELGGDVGTSYVGSDVSWRKRW